MSGGGRPTLADVAASAGVSLKTASRALNGEYGVAPATQARVLDAARHLGFRPNQLARSLASGRATAVVGLIVAGVADPFFAAVTGAVEEVLAPRDIQLITASHEDDEHRQRKLVRALVERRVDALLVVPAPGDASYLQAELAHGLPVVAVDRPAVGVEVDTVTADNRRAAREAVGRLVAAGHRRIAALGADARVWTIRERLQGYRSALRRAGIPADRSLVAAGAGNGLLALQTVEAMLRLPDPPTAVLAMSPRPGRHVLRAARAHGADLALATFDDILDADLLSPPPLVVHSDPVALGGAAVRMALERMGGHDGPPRTQVFPARLVDAAETATTPSGAGA